MGNQLMDLPENRKTQQHNDIRAPNSCDKKKDKKHP